MFVKGIPLQEWLDSGRTKRELAYILGMTEQAISAWKTRQVFIHEDPIGTIEVYEVKRLGKNRVAA